MAEEEASNGLMVTAGRAKALSAFLTHFLWVLIEVVKLYRIKTDLWLIGVLLICLFILISPSISPIALSGTIG